MCECFPLSTHHLHTCLLPVPRSKPRYPIPVVSVRLRLKCDGTRAETRFFFRRKERVHLIRQGRQFSRLLTAEVCASAVVMLDTPRSEVMKCTGYPLHSPVSPLLPLPCVTVCHQVSVGLYARWRTDPEFRNVSGLDLKSFETEVVWISLKRRCLSGAVISVICC